MSAGVNFMGFPDFNNSFKEKKTIYMSGNSREQLN